MMGAAMNDSDSDTTGNEPQERNAGDRPERDHDTSRSAADGRTAGDTPDEAGDVTEGLDGGAAPEHEIAKSLDAALRSLRDDASRLDELDDDERIALAERIADRGVELDRNILESSRSMDDDERS